jgi:hypothetical protein
MQIRMSITAPLTLSFTAHLMWFISLQTYEKALLKRMTLLKKDDFDEVEGSVGTLPFLLCIHSSVL